MTSDGHAMTGLSRRELLSATATAAGALVVGFWMPPSAGAQIINPEGATWAIDPAIREINAWVVVAPDETVTIRIAQTELGQGVWTSNAMMVCEELQCDWSKVQPQYASANRDGKELAPEWTIHVPAAGLASRAFRTACTGACAPTPRHP
jgi:isoquinoline 1-oxidoreductase subunit beta